MAPLVGATVVTPEWSPQQVKALDEVGQWLKGPDQVYTMFGYAGTGKTTLAKHLAAQADGLVLFAAYTGKAASVLRSKGCAGASTLHSLLYQVREEDRTTLDRLLEELAACTNDLDKREIAAEIRDERKRVARPRFSLNPDSAIRNAKVVVLDECSMVNTPLAKDLLSFGIKVLVQGDPAQLPPVKGAGFFTNKTPDILLTEIHRQAADNPIIRWATMTREGQRIPFEDLGDAKRIPKGQTRMSDLAASGAQLLTGKNVTRRALNTAARKALGFTGKYPRAGERLVILRNDRMAGVLNGVVCEAGHDAVYDPEYMEGSFGMTLKYEEGLREVEMDTQYFDAYENPARGEEPDDSFNRQTIPADYGYALTVHKAQGSQWDEVTVCDDGFAQWNPVDRRRWLYTAITRAAKRLTIIG